MAIIDDGISETGYAARGFRYVRAPEPIHFPVEDEEPVGETLRHLEARTALYWLLKRAIGDKATIGCDQFVYWERTDPQRCLSPDLFVKLGVPHSSMEVFKTWETGTPDVALEVMSASDRSPKEWAEKLHRYRASGIPELVRFDADDEKQSIRVWDEVDGDLVERSPTDPRHRFCRALGWWWVVVKDAEGNRIWLARDPDGREPLLTEAEEERLLAEQANARAAQADARAEQALREAEQLRAELARLRGERK